MDIAFSYSRKSPDEKEDTERSINNQEDLIKTLCLGKNWELRGSYSDRNISGSDRDRKALGECISVSMKYKVSNPIDNVYIVVKDQYRFARDSAFFQDTLRNLNAYGVNVFSVMKNDFLSHDDLGDNVLSLVAQETIKKGRQDALMTQEKKMRENLPCIPAPFGYKYDKNKNWSLQKKESQIVLGVIKNYLKSIDYRLTLRDFKINSSKYYRIIKNAQKGLYSGYCVFEKKYKDSNKNIVRIEDIKYPINVKPIISEELFNQL